MLFIVKDKKPLKKYIKIWETIEGLMKINFESKSVYGDDDKYIKTKIKTYAGSITTNFHSIFASFLQAYYDIYFFRILSFYSYLLR